VDVGAKSKKVYKSRETITGSAWNSD